MSLTAEDSEHWGRACAWVHFDHTCWPANGPDPKRSTSNIKEAKAEYDRISPDGKRDVGVLKLSTYLHGRLQLQDLPELVFAASELARLFPDEPCWVVEWAHGVRRLGSVETARDILTQAEKTYPANADIQFEFACTESQLGNFHKGRQHLFRAIEADPVVRGRPDPEIGPLLDGLTQEELSSMLHLPDAA